MVEPVSGEAGPGDGLPGDLFGGRRVFFQAFFGGYALGLDRVCPIEAVACMDDGADFDLPGGIGRHQVCSVEAGSGRRRNWIGVPIGAIADARVAAMAAVLSRDPASWLVTSQPTCDRLQALCREEGRRCDLVRRHERAFLRSDLDGEAYFEQAVRAKKRKELRRQKRRLEDMGTLRFLRSDGRQDLDGWIDAFLTLEASGWKGQEQSALGSQDRTRALFFDMLGAMAQAGKLELLSLEFEGAPIAMLVNLQSGDGIFSFKTTFDESFARFSPGVLLQIENYAMLDRPDIHWADSCAAPDHPMIDSLWTERREIGRLSIAIGGPLRRKAFDALRWMEDHMAKRQGSKG